MLVFVSLRQLGSAELETPAWRTVAGLALLHGDLHDGGLDLAARGHDNFTQTRDTEGDVLGTDAGKMEGVERHLRGWLADGLRGQQADRFAGVHQRMQVAQPHERAELVAVQRFLVGDARDVGQAAAGQVPALLLIRRDELDHQTDMLNDSR